MKLFATLTVRCMIIISMPMLELVLTLQVKVPSNPKNEEFLQSGLNNYNLNQRPIPFPNNYISNFEILNRLGSPLRPEIIPLNKSKGLPCLDQIENQNKAFLIKTEGTEPTVNTFKKLLLYLNNKIILDNENKEIGISPDDNQNPTVHISSQLDSVYPNIVPNFLRPASPHSMRVPVTQNFNANKIVINLDDPKLTRFSCNNYEDSKDHKNDPQTKSLENKITLREDQINGNIPFGIQMLPSVEQNYYGEFSKSLSSDGLNNPSIPSQTSTGIFENNTPGKFLIKQHSTQYDLLSNEEKNKFSLPSLNNYEDTEDHSNGANQAEPCGNEIKFSDGQIKGSVSFGIGTPPSVEQNDYGNFPSGFSPDGLNNPTTPSQTITPLSTKSTVRTFFVKQHSTKYDVPSNEQNNKFGLPSINNYVDSEDYTNGVISTQPGPFGSGIKFPNGKIKGNVSFGTGTPSSVEQNDYGDLPKGFSTDGLNNSGSHYQSNAWPSKDNTPGNFLMKQHSTQYDLPSNGPTNYFTYPSINHYGGSDHQNEVTSTQSEPSENGIKYPNGQIKGSISVGIGTPPSVEPNYFSQFSNGFSFDELNNLSISSQTNERPFKNNTAGNYFMKQHSTQYDLPSNGQQNNFTYPSVNNYYDSDHNIEVISTQSEPSRNGIKFPNGQIKGSIYVGIGTPPSVEKNYFSKFPFGFAPDGLNNPSISSQTNEQPFKNNTAGNYFMKQHSTQYDLPSNGQTNYFTYPSINNYGGSDHENEVTSTQSEPSGNGIKFPNGQIKGGIYLGIGTRPSVEKNYFSKFPFGFSPDGLNNPSISSQTNEQPFKNNTAGNYFMKQHSTQYDLPSNGQTNYFTYPSINNYGGSDHQNEVTSTQSEPSGNGIKFPNGQIKGGIYFGIGTPPSVEKHYFSKFSNGFSSDGLNNLSISSQANEWPFKNNTAGNYFMKQHSTQFDLPSNGQQNNFTYPSINNYGGLDHQNEVTSTQSETSGNGIKFPNGQIKGGIYFGIGTPPSVEKHYFSKFSNGFSSDGLNNLSMSSQTNELPFKNNTAGNYFMKQHSTQFDLPSNGQQNNFTYPSVNNYYDSDHKNEVISTQSGPSGNGIKFPNGQIKGGISFGIGTPPSVEKNYFTKFSNGFSSDELNNLSISSQTNERPFKNNTAGNYFMKQHSTQYNGPSNGETNYFTYPSDKNYGDSDHKNEVISTQSEPSGNGIKFPNEPIKGGIYFGIGTPPSVEKHYFSKFSNGFSPDGLNKLSISSQTNERPFKNNTAGNYFMKQHSTQFDLPSNGQQNNFTYPSVNNYYDSDHKNVVTSTQSGPSGIGIKFPNRQIKGGISFGIETPPSVEKNYFSKFSNGFSSDELNNLSISSQTNERPFKNNTAGNYFMKQHSTQYDLPSNGQTNYFTYPSDKNYGDSDHKNEVISTQSEPSANGIKFPNGQIKGSISVGIGTPPSVEKNYFSKFSNGFSPDGLNKLSISSQTNERRFKNNTAGNYFMKQHSTQFELPSNGQTNYFTYPSINNYGGSDPQNEVTSTQSEPSGNGIKFPNGQIKGGIAFGVGASHPVKQNHFNKFPFGFSPDGLNNPSIPFQTNERPFNSNTPANCFIKQDFTRFDLPSNGQENKFDLPSINNYVDSEDHTNGVISTQPGPSGSGIKFPNGQIKGSISFGIGASHPVEQNHFSKFPNGFSPDGLNNSSIPSQTNERPFKDNTPGNFLLKQHPTQYDLPSNGQTNNFTYLSVNNYGDSDHKNEIISTQSEPSGNGIKFPNGQTKGSISFGIGTSPSVVDNTSGTYFMKKHPTQYDLPSNGQKNTFTYSSVNNYGDLDHKNEFIYTQSGPSGNGFKFPTGQFKDSVPFGIGTSTSVEQNHFNKFFNSFSSEGLNHPSIPSQTTEPPFEYNTQENFLMKQHPTQYDLPSNGQQNTFTYPWVNNYYDSDHKIEVISTQSGPSGNGIKFPNGQTKGSISFGIGTSPSVVDNTSGNYFMKQHPTQYDLPSNGQKNTFTYSSVNNYGDLDHKNEVISTQSGASGNGIKFPNRPIKGSVHFGIETLVPVEQNNDGKFPNGFSPDGINNPSVPSQTNAWIFKNKIPENSFMDQQYNLLANEQKNKFTLYSLNNYIDLEGHKKNAFIAVAEPFENEIKLPDGQIKGNVLSGTETLPLVEQSYYGKFLQSLAPDGLNNPSIFTQTDSQLFKNKTSKDFFMKQHSTQYDLLLNELKDKLKFFNGQIKDGDTLPYVVENSDGKFLKIFFPDGLNNPSISSQTNSQLFKNKILKDFFMKQHSTQYDLPSNGQKNKFGLPSSNDYEDSEDHENSFISTQTGPFGNKIRFPDGQIKFNGGVSVGIETLPSVEPSYYGKFFQTLAPGGLNNPTISSQTNVRPDPYKFFDQTDEGNVFVKLFNNYMYGIPFRPNNVFLEKNTPNSPLNVLNDNSFKSDIEPFTKIDDITASEDILCLDVIKKIMLFLNQMHHRIRDNGVLKNKYEGLPTPVYNNFPNLYPNNEESSSQNNIFPQNSDEIGVLPSDVPNRALFPTVTPIKSNKIFDIPPFNGNVKPNEEYYNKIPFGITPETYMKHLSEGTTLTRHSDRSKRDEDLFQTDIVLRSKQNGGNINEAENKPKRRKRRAATPLTSLNNNNFSNELKENIDFTQEAANNKLSDHPDNLIVERHNKLRSILAEGKVLNQPRAVNLKQLEWDAKLALDAQKLCDAGTQRNITIVDDRWPVGQNVYEIKVPLNASQEPVWNTTINTWWDENKRYRYPKPSRKARHYIQMVWADTKYLGCGYRFFTIKGGKYARKIHICLYGPAGNVKGEKPYKIEEL